MRTFALLLLAALIAGCSNPSLKPLYTDDVIVQDDAILGTWADDQDGRATVTRNGTGYTVVCEKVDDQAFKPVELHVVLVELDGQRYIDIAASEKSRQDVAERFGFLFVPAHVFARVTLDGNQVSIEQIDLDWLTMHAPNLGINHVVVEDTGVLTDEPKALQELLKQLRERPEAFTDPYLLRREQG